MKVSIVNVTCNILIIDAFDRRAHTVVGSRVVGFFVLFNSFFFLNLLQSKSLSDFDTYILILYYSLLYFY